MRGSSWRSSWRSSWKLSLALGAALVACRAASARELALQADAAPPSRAAFDTSGPLWMEMRNVDLHIDERAVLQLRLLRGEVLPTQPGQPAVLDDARSFSVRVTSGTVALSGDALDALLNGNVFAYKGAPLRHLRTRVRGDRIVQRGIMHKGVDLPFEITATVGLEPDGRVRLHPTRTRILGVDGQKLLHALGLRLDKLVDLRGARGASVKGDDLFLEPTVILPPPAIVGRLAAIRLEDGMVVQDFVRLADDSLFEGYARVADAAPNRVYFRGGRLRFGKLLMSDTDLEIVDADPRDPFDLNLARYARQLVAGTSQTLPSLGLRVVMPDYRMVVRAATAPVVGAAH